MTDTTRAIGQAGIDRRRFLQASIGAAGAGAVLGIAPGRAAGSKRRGLGSRSAAGPARNVIFMVSDGMSYGTLTLADLLARTLHGRGTNWVAMLDAPGVRRSLCATYAADAYVTDSAAAASAWGIGELVNNGSVNITPDGREPTPILAHASQNGKATGLVTTTRITHATPAGFIANVPRRGLEDPIAEQIMDRGVDVALGGGARHFPPGLLEGHDVTVVRSAGELEAARGQRPDGRFMGLFTPSHMSYEIDRGEDEPTLAQMTTAALEMLDGRGGGFVLQVEGGRVDHGAHANDAGAMLYDQLAFDDAIGAALEFIDGRDDTLLIITTDHGNANPGLTFYGEQGIRGLERLRQTRSSIGRMLADGRRRGGGADDPAPLGGAVLEATGIELSEQDLDFLTRAIDGRRVDPFMPANRPGLVLGALLANHTGVRFLSPNHTSDHVEVTATGPGSEMLTPTLAINQLHELVTKALDLAPARPLR